MSRRRLASSFLAMLVSVAPVSIQAFDLVETDSVRLDLTGYLQVASGFQQLGYDLPLDLPTTSGFSAQVLRLQWGLQLGDMFTVDVHNRVFSTVTSAPQGMSASMGLGASIAPGRTLDLSSTLVEEEGFALRHDIDRLAVRVFFDRGELVVGRQAITWGDAMLFRVADLWTQFSPFELDQTQKPGTDALRVLLYPAGSLELDFIIADRGSLEDLSGGMRASMVLGSADVYLAGGKFWNELLAMAGVAYDLVLVKARGEVVVPYDMDASELSLPRATLGVDYFSAQWQLSAEYHFNGAGVTSPDDYLEHYSHPVVARGESYYLNRHYTGLIGSYGGVDRLRLSLGAMANLVDPSVILTPSISYEISDNADIILGAFHGIGKSPTFDPFPTLHSEFGTSGAFYFTQIRGFF